MGNTDKRYLLNFLLHSKNLTKTQVAKRNSLFARDFISTPDTALVEPPIRPKSVIPHVPKDTAAFLSLFNNPNGFKFLTHDFDPESNMDYAALMELVRRVFKDECKRYEIPKNLYALMETFINGGRNKDGGKKQWRDYLGNWHEDNYACEQWREWAINNPGHHLLSNEEFSKTIMLFRSSIRLVKPALVDIINRQKEKHGNLMIETNGLNKADFYTYVWALENGIQRILDDFTKYSAFPEVSISYERNFSDEYTSRIIRITQKGSFSSTIDDVIKKFKAGGGAFNEIKDVLLGYCNWSVETIWDGQAKRWNILNDSNKAEVEEINGGDVPGFTHVLTFFSK